MTAILCVDFDGVIHSYVSGWQGATVINDQPMPGALEWLAEMTDTFDVQIFSSRSNQPGGLMAMQDWLFRWAINLKGEGRFRNDPHLNWVTKIKWPTAKPPAKVTLDDRAIQFTGRWPSVDELHNFQPYRLGD